MKNEAELRSAMEQIAKNGTSGIICRHGEPDVVKRVGKELGLDFIYFTEVTDGVDIGNVVVWLNQHDRLQIDGQIMQSGDTLSVQTSSPPIVNFPKK